MGKKYRSKREILLDIKYSKLLELTKNVSNSDYDGKEVRITFADFQTRIENNELSNLFINWIADNINKTFIAKKSHLEYVYSLEGVDNWLFSIRDLELVD